MMRFLALLLSLLPLSAHALSGAIIAATQGTPDTIVGQWVNAAAANSGTVTSGRRALVVTLVTCQMVALSWYALDDALNLIAEDAGSALVSYKRRVVATAVASPTFTADRGYGVLNGTTQYINTNQVPSSTWAHGNATNARIGTYERTNVAASLTSSIGATASNMFMNPRNGTGAFQVSLLSGSGNVATGRTESRGMSTVSFTAGSNTRDAWVNGAAQAGASVTTAGVLSVHALYLGARNAAGTADQFRATTMGLGYWGAPISSAAEGNDYTCWQNFMTSVGANV